MAQTEDIVGIDVSKLRLDIHVLASRRERQLANDPAGFAELVDWLKSLQVRRVAMEASGGYERAVAKALRQAGFAVLVLDPKRVRFYAKALGRLAKTDRIDAWTIAEFGAVVMAAERCDLAADDPAREALSALVGARQDLVAHLTGLQQQAAMTSDRAAGRVLATVVKAMTRQVTRLDQLIADKIAEHPPFAALAARLDTVPGLGPVTIAAIIAWLPELGRLDRGKIAALVGVAPMDDTSGERVGQRYIQGGRAKLRNVLYMAAMVSATRHNPVLKAHYAQLRARGKEPKLAIIACLRKLLTILNTMVARQEDWHPRSTEVAA
jgi:transposase